MTRIKREFALISNRIQHTIRFRQSKVLCILFRYTGNLGLRGSNIDVGIRPGVEYAESVVTLLRQETGFGFRIVGGTEEGSQVGAMVRLLLCT